MQDASQDNLSLSLRQKAKNLFLEGRTQEASQILRTLRLHYSLFAPNVRPFQNLNHKGGFYAHSSTEQLCQCHRHKLSP